MVHRTETEPIPKHVSNNDRAIMIEYISQHAEKPNRTYKHSITKYTLEDDPMDPENHWLVEENHLPGGQTVRVRL